ncbi:adenylate/guanylate cyclase domain-containing protein [uncultured Victivallis sp.]|uniref:adenylate/guanylate cyclase domain-containing protein n=1 Tax=uncultured Victivallis sp. TaxID=354118 RepID=UPI0025CB9C06|nr:adenylate/guanylate cyclase domain-containing protein [uncultured Victivallis sp.]
MNSREEQAKIAELETRLAAEQARNAELEAQLKSEREAALDQRFSMVENSLRLLELKESLEAEKEKSAKLLRNLLPERVIADLQENGASKPERFEHVTVLFSDIVGFTDRCAALDPEEVLAELTDIFTEFDRIFTRHNCERIKTIGDAYLCVSGLPTPTDQHCANILAGAGEALHYLENRNLVKSHVWRMRFGVHTGRVVGGIVGTEKYIYDIFGDTVNTAARMEQLSEPMRINVSQAVRDTAPETFRFLERPAQEVKGKGMMKMYFLDVHSPCPER